MNQFEGVKVPIPPSPMSTELLDTLVELAEEIDKTNARLQWIEEALNLKVGDADISP